MSVQCVRVKCMLLSVSCYVYAVKCMLCMMYAVYEF